MNIREDNYSQMTFQKTIYDWMFTPSWRIYEFNYQTQEGEVIK